MLAAWHSTAKFVFVGRPFVYAAAIEGEAGVSHAINVLSIEVSRNMGLLGVNSLKEMSLDRPTNLGHVGGMQA
jgi:L-lactate dehydrogenase (cytochrome)